jgi:ParB family chromosome partitioning protein
MSDTDRRPRKRFTVDALFSDTRSQAVGVRDLTEAKHIALGRIQRDPSQPRRTFDPVKLEELAASIRVEGVLQPIVVRFDAENDRYVIVHGERRWRAAAQAGLAEIPAIVRDVPVERRLLQQLMENVVRDDLNAVDRAAALRALRSQMGDPGWDAVADAVGIKRSRLFQLLGTGKLDTAAQDDIRSGRLSEKQSRALQGLSSTRQEALRYLIIERNLSAQAAIRLARAWKGIEFTPPDDAAAAKRSLDQVYGFVFATSDDQLQAQTRVLLGAIRNAATGSTTARGQLKSLASTLDAHAFRENRFSQEVNALARTLASIPAGNVNRSPAVDAPLRDLRDAIDAILVDLPQGHDEP